MNFNIKDVKFSIVESLNPKFVEVVVNFVYENINRQHYVFITRRKDYKEKDYLKEAKEAFYNDLRNGRVNFKKKASPLLVGLASFFAVTTLALGGFLTYKLVVNPKDDPIVPPVGDIKLELDDESLKEATLEPLTAKKGENYKGTLTMKEKDKGLVLSHSIIKSGDQDLMYGEDFTIESKGDTNGKYEYSLNISSNVMTNNISLHLPSGDVNDFKIQDETEFKNILSYLEKPDAKAKLVDFVNLPSRPLPGYTCSTYTGDITKAFVNSCDGIFEEQIFVFDSEKKLKEFYINEGEDMYYLQSGVQPDVPTIQKDLAYVSTKRKIEQGASFSSYRFDESTLSYVYDTDPEGIVTIKAYKGNIVECSTSAIGNNRLNSFHFFYDFSKIEKPDSSNSYTQSDLEMGAIVSKEEWNDLLTLDDSERLLYKVKVDAESAISSYGYNKDVIAVTTTPSLTASIDIYSHESDKYFRYSPTGTSAQPWEKHEIEKKAYDHISYDSIKDNLSDVRDNIDEFTYDQEIKSYVSETYIPGKAFGVNFVKINSIDRSRSEIHINAIGADGEERLLKIINRAAKIYLPVVSQ